MTSSLGTDLKVHNSINNLASPPTQRYAATIFIECNPQDDI